METHIINNISAVNISNDRPHSGHDEIFQSISKTKSDLVTREKRDKKSKKKKKKRQSTEESQ